MAVIERPTTPYPDNHDKDREYHELHLEYDRRRRDLWERFGQGQPSPALYNRHRAALDQWYVEAREVVAEHWRELRKPWDDYYAARFTKRGESR
jgi:hypothetical protein